MTRFSRSLAFLFALALAVTAVGCDASGDDDIDEETFDGDVQAILEAEAYDVILATYQTLNSEAGALVDAAGALASAPTPQNLEAARAQWRQTRRPWEQSESFLFGPVDDQGYDPSLDSWPTSEEDIQSVLDDGEPITVERIAALDPDAGGGRKGFHTVEYLLFGPDGVKAAGDFTAREFDYLTAAAGALKLDTQGLVDGWTGADGEAAAFASAGAQSSEYVSPKDALDELVNGMDIIADEVGTGKIGTPLSEESIFRVESKYSRNSLNDFRNNVRSIRNIYTGDYGGNDGPGLGEIVEDLRPDLDAQIRGDIDAAIASLDAIESSSGSFRDAIESGNLGGVAAAQDAVLEIRDTVQNELAPFLSQLQL